MNAKAPILSSLSVAMTFTMSIGRLVGWEFFEGYGSYFYFFPVVPLSWILAVFALVFRDRDDGLTLVLSIFTLTLWPALAFIALLLGISHDYNWPIRFWSASSLFAIVRPVWYIWGGPTLGAMTWIAWRRWPAIRRLRWFQIAALASLIALAFVWAVASVVALADLPSAIVMWPVTLALCWTTFGWASGRRFRTARPLRVVVGMALPVVVFFTSVPRWPTALPERPRPWLAFGFSELGVPILLLSLALFLAPDPGKRKRRRRPAARPVEGKDTSGPANTGTDAMEDVR